MLKILQKHVALWDLAQDANPEETPSSILCFVTRGNKRAVLKVFKPHADEKNSAKVLRQFDGKGAVKVLQASDEAVLLERLTSGSSLSELVVDCRDDESTKVFCEVTQQLHTARFEPDDVRPLSVLLNVYEKYLVSGSAILPVDTVAHAKATFEDLCSTQKEVVLLHGDLHHDNILHDDRQGWLCIDPVGYIGEQEFEAAAFLKNPNHPRFYANEQIINRRIKIISETLGLHPHRILRWTYCYYVITLLWNIEDGVFKNEDLPMLSILQKMIIAKA